MNKELKAKNGNYESSYEVLNTAGRRHTTYVKRSLACLKLSLPVVKVWEGFDTNKFKKFDQIILKLRRILNYRLF